MPIFGLSDELAFPPPELADESGILAVGGDYKPERLLLAYRNGIFPWPHADEPLLWFSPSKRFVLRPKDIHLSKSLRKTMRKNSYRVSFDQCFALVMRGCQSAQRPGQDSTWITDEMIDGYHQLHQMGFAHSIEAYDGDHLVGGLYGISLGGTFFGESMFALAPEASKIAFATLAGHLIAWDFDLIDCQAETDHLKRFGAKAIPRAEFLTALHDSQLKRTRRGKWSCTMSSREALDKVASLI